MKELMMWMKWSCEKSFFVRYSKGSGFGCPSMYSFTYIIFTEYMHATHNSQPLFLLPTFHPRTHIMTQPTRHRDNLTEGCGMLDLEQNTLAHSLTYLQDPTSTAEFQLCTMR